MGLCAEDEFQNANLPKDHFNGNQMVSTKNHRSIMN